MVPPFKTITPATTIPPTLATETTDVALGVYQHVNVVAILIMKDMPSPQFSTKRGYDDIQASITKDDSVKRSRVIGDASPGQMTSAQHYQSESRDKNSHLVCRLPHNTIKVNLEKRISFSSTGIGKTIHNTTHLANL